MMYLVVFVITIMVCYIASLKTKINNYEYTVKDTARRVSNIQRYARTGFINPSHLYPPDRPCQGYVISGLTKAEAKDRLTHISRDAYGEQTILISEHGFRFFTKD